VFDAILYCSISQAKMNQTVSLLLIACLLVVANGKGLKKRQPPQSCGNDLQTCVLLIERLYGENTPDTKEEIEELIPDDESELRTQCSNIQQVVNCFITQLSTSDCQQDPQLRNFQSYLIKINGFVEFLCEDQFDNFVEHLECFVTTDDDDECDPADVNVLTCDASEWTNCMKTAMADNNKCKPGAEDLLEDTVEEFFKLIDHCNVAEEILPMLRKQFARVRALKRLNI